MLAVSAPLIRPGMRSERYATPDPKTIREEGRLGRDVVWGTVDQTFDSHQYCEGLGKRLVEAFGAAGGATSPGLVGTAREGAVRRELEAALPGGLAVGTGCVIDSYGGTSRQQDIVVFERDLCPVFSIADSPEASYYPCEGVIAVGEVKSRLDSDCLRDVFQKISSVKRLRRRAELEPRGFPGQPDTVPFRSYCSTVSTHGLAEQQFDQDANEWDQIYGFAVAGDQSLSEESILDAVTAHVAAAPKHEAVDSIFILGSGSVRFIRGTTAVRGASTADAVGLATEPSPFNQLLVALIAAAQRGRTVPRQKFLTYYAEPNSQSSFSLKRPMLPE